MFSDDWHSSLHRGDPEGAVIRVEAILHVRLPSDYRSFLLASDGADGMIGAHYVILWGVDDLIRYNTREGGTIAGDLPGIIEIGSNGGGESYCLDYRSDASAPNIVLLPQIGYDEDDALAVGASFTEAIENLRRWPGWPFHADGED